MRHLLVLVGSLALTACSGKDDAGEKDEAGPASDAPAASGDGNAPTSDPTAGDPTNRPPDPPTKDPDAAPPEPTAEPHRGPCTIDWSDGRQLKFKYTDEGGSVNVDVDGDGKRDTCGTFKAVDGRPTYLRLDEGCDRETDGTLRLKYEEGTLLASGTMTRGDETSRLTVIPIPSFGGVVPGYTLPGRAKDLKIEEADGKIQAVTVKKGAGRPAKKISFSYDAAGRVSGITEDVGADGSAELQFTYVYDPSGNVESIRTIAGDTEATAKLGYACWE